MQTVLKIKHQYKCGDVICLLPGLKHLYETKGIKSLIYQQIGLKLTNDGTKEEMMTEEMFYKLAPLIKSQEYILDFEKWEGQEFEFDMATTRDRRLVPIPNSDIHFWAFFLFPELQCDLSVRWLTLPPNGNIFNDLVISDHVLINRTDRYINPYLNFYFLKKHEDKLIFSGTEKEYTDFCEAWDLKIPRLIVNNFLELAQAIKYCKFLLSNQSFNFHIADAMKTPRLMEMCSAYPNTLPTGKNGYAFAYQVAMEMYFQNLIEK
jgi:hypothetical protein